MFRALKTSGMFVLLLWGSSLWAAEGPAPDIDLKAFGHFEVKTTAFGEGQQAQYRSDQVARQIENILRTKVKEWNTAHALPGTRSLTIQPVIERLKLKVGSVLPRNPEVTLQLRLTDTANGALIAQPEFSDKADGLAATFAHGRGDDDVLTHVAREAADYLDRNYHAAIDALTQQRTQAVAHRREQAEQGDVSSQVMLGMMYALGQDVPRDYGQAVTWWRKAAEQHDASAQFHLAEAYAAGHGVPADEGQAAMWYRKAAEQNDPQAQRALAALYESGRGVPRDEKTALVWYQKAADRGSVAAKNYLVRRSRSTAQFSSFEDADQALAPEAGLDVQLVMDPMGLRDRILVLRLSVLQVLNDGALLLTSPFADQLPGGHVFYGFLPPNYSGRRDFVDGQSIVVVGEIVGTFQYTANLGGQKTVPKIRIYGVRADFF